MTVSLFGKRKTRPAPSKLEDLTLRGFGGGLNIVDDDTNVEPKYQTSLKNFRRTTSGSQTVRFGTNWFADVKDTMTGSTIIDIAYFNNVLVAVTETGQMSTITNSGGLTRIWSAAIAAGLPGAPSGWSTTGDVSFVPWKDQLIIHNGVDKPVIISSVFAVTYLQDLGTGSNVNVPIGKYGCIAANYHCVAGIAGALTTIYIGNKGTSGTFPGDLAPNDAISIDVGAYAPSGAPEILGIAGYRTKLIVFFRGQSLIIQLGEYDNATTPNHVPRFEDEMPQFGLINHRSIIPVENDLRFAGYDGLASGSRNLFSGTINSKFLSAIVEPDWRVRVAQSVVSKPFLVQNGIEHASLLFLNDDEGTVQVYQANAQLKFEAWTQYKGLAYKCGCKSFLDRVFVASGTRIFQMGNNVYLGEAFHADRLGDRDAAWAHTTAYTAGTLLVESTGTITVDVNGGFENGYTGWNIIPPDPTTLAASIDFFGGTRTGVKSALFNPVTGLKGYNMTSDDFLVQAGKTYTLSGYFIGSGGTLPSPNGLYFGIEFRNESGALLQTSSVVTDGALTSAYVQKTGAFVAPDLAHSGRVFIMLKNTAITSQMLVDDIVLTTTATFGSVYEVLQNHTSPGTGTLADDIVAHPTRFALWEGVPIDFEFELPWTDGRNPMRVKENKFVSLDTRGTAPFTLQAFVDFDTVNVAATMDFVGNDATSGARSNNPQLYEFPVKFKTLKSKIIGSSREAFTVASLRFLFSKGRFRR